MLKERDWQPLCHNASSFEIWRTRFNWKGFQHRMESRPLYARTGFDDFPSQNRQLPLSVSPVYS